MIHPAPLPSYTPLLPLHPFLPILSPFSSITSFRFTIPSHSTHVYIAPIPFPLPIYLHYPYTPFHPPLLPFIHNYPPSSPLYTSTSPSGPYFQYASPPFTILLPSILSPTTHCPSSALLDLSPLCPSIPHFPFLASTPTLFPLTLSFYSSPDHLLISKIPLPLTSLDIPSPSTLRPSIHNSPPTIPHIFPPLSKPSTTLVILPSLHTSLSLTVHTLPSLPPSSPGPSLHPSLGQPPLPCLHPSINPSHHLHISSAPL